MAGYFGIQLTAHKTNAAFTARCVSGTRCINRHIALLRYFKKALTLGCVGDYRFSLFKSKGYFCHNL